MLKNIFVVILLLTIAIVFLPGCSTQQTTEIPFIPPTTVPTSVVYNQNSDRFHIETEPVTRGMLPIYPNTLSFFTLIDDEQHDGLIPPVLYRHSFDGDRTKLWHGPWWVQYKENEWKIFRVQMFPKIKIHENDRAKIQQQTIRRSETLPPVYHFIVANAQYSIPQD